MVILICNDWFMCPRHVPIGKVEVEGEPIGYYQDDVADPEFRGARYRFERTVEPGAILGLTVGGLEYICQV